MTKQEQATALSAAAAAMGKAGGVARAQKLSPRRRREIARLGAAAARRKRMKKT